MLPSGSPVMKWIFNVFAEASLGWDIHTALFHPFPSLVYGIADVAEELLQQMLDENLRRSSNSTRAVACCGFTPSSHIGLGNEIILIDPDRTC